ncbi:hypothetical protein SAMN02745121_01177 [Nannocystis exedens]|uniref:Uncharacterized protein n=1 Tax=Nannocystis exedens TaxID=54 RepID=A0A1I1UDU7_9BACT|nr:hypothetical protein [Nannocystis exedens]PCC71634.1 hypothetical protein NAEX_04711 [Nannocystis exedens]SFD69001.1 hypothetical protein SAMN02745121_01177 [Nannocystis exedens]
MNRRDGQAVRQQLLGSTWADKQVELHDFGVTGNVTAVDLIDEALPARAAARVPLERPPWAGRPAHGFAVSREITGNS